jgi:ubiquinone biosynthesis protein UbiJ
MTVMAPSAALLETAGRVINYALSRDPVALAALAALAGRTILVEISDLSVRFCLLPSAQGLQLAPVPAGEPDVLVRGGIVALIGMILRRPEQGDTAAGRVEIVGDVHLAQRLQLILRNLDIDWEEWLAQWIGDLPARKLCNLGRALRQQAGDAWHTLGKDLSEYLRYERDLVVDQTEIEEFAGAVDRLRDDTERLAQRLKRLERRTGGGA